MNGGGLQLSRKTGEQVVVYLDGKELILTVSEVKGGTVKINFQGNKEFQIYRQEIAEDALNRA